MELQDNKTIECFRYSRVNREWAAKHKRTVRVESFPVGLTIHGNLFTRVNIHQNFKGLPIYLSLPAN